MKRKKTKRSRISTIIVSMIGLFLVVMLLVVVAVFVLNSSWFSSFAEAKLSEYFGQEVSIDSIAVDFGPTIRIRMENAVVANPAWASAPYFATLETLEFGIDGFELLSGHLVLSDVQLDKPVVHLERTIQGTANWALDKKGETVPNDQQVSENQSNDDGALNLPRIESFLIEEGRLTYLDPTRNTSLELLLKSRDPEAPMDSGEILVDGEGYLMGEPITVDLSAGLSPVLAESDRNIYPLELQLNSAETTLTIEGTVDAPISPEFVDLQVRLEGQNLSRWNEAFSMELPALPMYQLSGRLSLVENVWSLDPIHARVLNSDLTGTLWLTPNANPPLVEGVLSSERLDLEQLQEFMPEKDDSKPVTVQLAELLGLIANASVQANIQYHADLIETQEIPINDVEIAMKLENNVVSFEPLAGTVDRTQFHVESNISADEELTGGRMQFRVETAQSPENAKGTETGRVLKTTTLPTFPGNLVAELTLKVTTHRVPGNANDSVQAEGENSVNHIDLKSAIIENLHVTYTELSSNTKIVAGLNEDLSDGDMVIEGKGEFRDEPIELSLTIPELDSLKNLSTDESARRLAFDLKLAAATASVVASIVPSWPPTEMDLRFIVESDIPATTAALFEVELPALGNLAMSGSLSRRNHMWKITEFKSHVGESNMYGMAIINTADNLRFEAVLKSNMLDMASLIPTKSTANNPSESKPSKIPLLESNSSENMSVEYSSPPWLTSLDGKVRVSVQHLVLPGVTLDDVSIKATVNEGLLLITPLSIALGGGTINTKVNLDLKAPLLAGNLLTEIQHVDLGQALTAFGNEPSALGIVAGRIALKLPNITQRTKKSSSVDTILDRLRIEEFSLQYDDPDLQAKTNLRLTADSFESEMRIEGNVEYEGIPVDVSLTTGSLRQGIEDYRALPVDATLHIRETTIDIDSHIRALFPLESLTTSLRLAGPDLFRLGEAINTPLPHLPPYDLQAKLERKQLDDGQQIFIFKNLKGTIGDSDVNGKLRVTTGGDRPMIFTRLQSRKLDFDDLAGLTGASPDPKETASATQKQQTKQFEHRDALLPDKPIDFTKLQDIDADVEYRASSVQAPNFPLDDILLKMDLQEGHLRMNRLDFGVANGTVAMQLEVNARTLPVKAKLISDFDQVNLSKLLASFEVADNTFGNIGGRATLWMQGESLADWFGSADGGLYLTMTGGKVDALLVELAGLDFTESAVAFLGTDTGVPIDCAYTDFQARSGIVTIHPFLFDTQDTKFQGHGKIDLRQEKMNLTVNPYPKDFTFLSSRGPLHVTGTFSNPSFSVDPSFPFPEFGTADDSARCSGTIEALRKARKNSMDERKIKFDPA